MRATEVHRYKIILIENVVEAASWELFDIWLAAMDKMGYNHQFISVSSAHIGDEANPHAPQWRDRLYIVFTAVSLPLIDIRPRPLAWCPNCDEINPPYGAVNPRLYHHHQHHPVPICPPPMFPSPALPQHNPLHAHDPPTRANRYQPFSTSPRTTHLLH